MTTLAGAAQWGSSVARRGWLEEEYVTEDGAQRVELADAWTVRFELAAPGQRHLPGRLWSATDSGHVGYESCRDPAHVLPNLDPTVVGIVSRPSLAFLDGGGARSCHMSRTTSPAGWMGLAARDGVAVGTALVQLKADGIIDVSRFRRAIVAYGSNMRLAATQSVTECHPASRASA
jgi:hypothetical protein